MTADERVWTETDAAGNEWLVVDTQGLSPELRRQLRERLEQALAEATR